MPLPDTLVYERCKPDLRTCCICGSQAGPFTFEDRLTGKDKAPQKWAWCRECWERRIAETKDTDPIVCQW